MKNFCIALLIVSASALRINDTPAVTKCMWAKVDGTCQDISGKAKCVGEMPEECPSLEASDVQLKKN